jgi:tRNA-splicing ligase RtcB
MSAAANVAFANRQVIAHLAREAFAKALDRGVAASMRQAYDVCHNFAKLER